MLCKRYIQLFQINTSMAYLLLNKIDYAYHPDTGQVISGHVKSIILNFERGDFHEKCVQGCLSIAAGFCLFISGLSVSVFDQETESSEFTLRKIIVTAEKRELDTQKTGMALKAMDRLTNLYY